MFDKNEFKKKVKVWIRQNPKASEHDLHDFCDEIMPPNHFAANQWLINQTVSWYKHILESREKAKKYVEDEEIY